VVADFSLTTSAAITFPKQHDKSGFSLVWECPEAMSSTVPAGSFGKRIIIAQDGKWARTFESID